MKMVAAIFLFLLALSASADTHTAAGTSTAQVQAAIDASSDGDFVILPAGTATWTSGVNITKSIVVSGNGIGSTVITQNFDGPSFNLAPAAGKFTTLKSLSVVVTGNHPATYSSVFWIDGRNQPNFRLSNMRVDTPQIGSIVYGVNAYGVIDHLYIRHPGTDSTQGITINTDGNQSSITNWYYPQPYSTTNALVIEDCVFDFDNLGDGAIDAYPGVKFVFRHNIVTNTVVAWHGMDSSTRAPRLWEVYHNQFYTSGGVQPFITIRSRGGTGVIWSNTVAVGSGYKEFIQISQFRAEPGYGSAPGQSYDGNFDKSYPAAGYSTGYPLLDQAGRGSYPNGPSGDWPWNGNDPNCSSGCTTNQYQALEPVYSWGNTWKGAANALLGVGNPEQTTNYVKVNRDYYDNTPKPGYTPLVYPHPIVTAQDGGGSTNPPAITAQPVGTTNSTTGGFLLSVTATGSSLAYQWRTNSMAVSGATSATYGSTPAVVGQSGSYTVKITNSYGAVTSSVALVSITNPVAAPTQFRLQLGGSVSSGNFRM